MSNCLDPDQEPRSVGPDLGTNCLQRLSADNKLSLTRKVTSIFFPPAARLWVF